MTHRTIARTVRLIIMIHQVAAEAVGSVSNKYRLSVRSDLSGMY